MFDIRVVPRYSPSRIFNKFEQVIDLHAELPRDPEREHRRGYILPLLDRDDRLPPHTDVLGKLLLRQVETRAVLFDMTDRFHT